MKLDEKGPATVTGNVDESSTTMSQLHKMSEVSDGRGCYNATTLTSTRLLLQYLLLPSQRDFENSFPPHSLLLSAPVV